MPNLRQPFIVEGGSQPGRQTPDGSVHGGIPGQRRMRGARLGGTSLGVCLRSILSPNRATDCCPAEGSVIADQPKNTISSSALKYDEFAAFVAGVLLDFPSIFERLVYLVRLKKAENDGRLHDELGRRFPEWCIDCRRATAAIEWHHRSIFEDWLRLSLEDKLADLDVWASRFGTTRAALARQWLQPQAVHELEPQAPAPEIALFRSDLELLLPVILAWER